MKCTLILSWLLCLSFCVSAQYRLNGRISSEGLVPEKVTIAQEGRNIAIADSSGNFSILFNSPGRVRLVFSAAGYRSTQQTFSIKDAVQEVEVRMDPDDSGLETVVVSGTMRQVSRLQSPVPVEVYSGQFFRKNPAPAVFEALQQVNGVRPQINCSVCNTGDIHINGLEGPYTMVTIDGMPVVSSLSSVYGLFGIPTQMIDRIEIIKGPASGLYGAEAIGGLINIITKSPEKAPLFAGQYFASSWNEHNVDLGMKWKAGSTRSLTGIHYFNYLDPVDRNKDGFTDLTLQHRISVFNKTSFARRAGRKASIAARYYYEDRWGGDMNWNRQFRGSDSIYGESIYTRRWELIGNYALPVEENMELGISFTSHDQDAFYGLMPYTGKQHIAFGQLVWKKDLFRHDLLLGVSARYQYYDDNSTATIDTASLKNRPEQFLLPGIFLQDEWKPAANHTVLFGLRMDHHPAHRFIFTPRIGYKWSRTADQSIRLNAGSGFRVVNIFTEDHAALTGARSVEILEDLKPEKSYNVNLNFLQQWKTGTGRIELDASAWYSYFTNQIMADYDQHPGKIIYQNLEGHAVSKGISLNLNAGFRRWKINSGITVQDIRRWELEEDKLISRRPLFTEPWSATWGISYHTILSGWTFDYTGNVYGSMRLPLVSDLDPRREYSPVWSIQNLQVSKWISSKLEFFGGIKNLLNWTPARNNPFLIPRTHDPFDKEVIFDNDGRPVATPSNPYALQFDPSYIYAPNQGRRGFAGLRVKVG